MTDKVERKLKPWEQDNADAAKGDGDRVMFFHSFTLETGDIGLTALEAFERAAKVLELEGIEKFGDTLLHEFQRNSGIYKVRGASIAVQGTRVGVALCSVKDQFSRKIGRTIAYGRMKKGQFHIEAGEVLPA